MREIMRNTLHTIGRLLIQSCPDSDWCSPAHEVTIRYRIGSFLIRRYGGNTY